MNRIGNQESILQLAKEALTPDQIAADEKLCAAIKQTSLGLAVPVGFCDRAAVALPLYIARIRELEVDVKRLRIDLADIHNTINLEGSPCDLAIKNIEALVSEIRGKARAALGSGGKG